MSKTGIRNLEARKVKGKTYYVYNPTKSAREAGLFKDKRTSFGQDFEAAKAAAEEYNKTLDRWLAQGKTIKATKKELNTVEAVTNRYVTDRLFRSLKPETKRLYAYFLDLVCKTCLEQSKTFFGQLKFDQVKRSEVNDLINVLERKHSEQTASYAARVFKRLYNIAESEWEIVNHNPFERVKVAGINRRTQRWTQAQVYHFYSTAIMEGRRSIGTIALLCYELVQRHVDMRFIRKEQVKEYSHGLVLEIIQSKTGTEVHLDVEHIRPQIEEMYEAAGDSEYLCPREETGDVWRDRSVFGKFARRIARKANIPDHLRISDLRRTGAKEMVEAGATHQELKDQGGWVSDASVSHYTPRGTETARSGQRKRLEQRRKAS